MTIMHTKNRIGTCTEYNIITIEENGQKNFVSGGARTRDLALHIT